MSDDLCSSQNCSKQPTMIIDLIIIDLSSLILSSLVIIFSFQSCCHNDIIFSYWIAQKRHWLVLNSPYFAWISLCITSISFCDVACCIVPYEFDLWSSNETECMKLFSIPFDVNIWYFDLYSSALQYDAWVSVHYGKIVNNISGLVQKWGFAYAETF